MLTTAKTKPLRALDNYEKALWNWVNIDNLDAFLQDVYYYYEGKGIYSIALSRGLSLLTVGFVIAFSTFLLRCIDYSKFRHGGPTQLADVMVDRCVSRFSGFTLVLLLFSAFYIWQIVAYVAAVRELMKMYQFYTHLLRIPDSDIPTISWPEIVRRIGAIREDNPLTGISSKNARGSNDIATAKLDAHDIANRIMRQENYLIAIFNKDLLDLRVPLPEFFKRFTNERRNGKILTQALEWNLRICLLEFHFDKQGRVKKDFLKSTKRKQLIKTLQNRFMFMSIMNAIFAPFIVLYLIMYSFFRYFEEYHKDPSSIGGRRYTSFARWKFREFNELPHLFTRRLDESYPLASMYIGQFPNEKIAIIMRFVAFVAGSFAAVLVLATIIDPDVFFHFEITPHRTVVFYLGAFGAILTAARSMVPADNKVFDPELLMMEVINYTHYMPDSWKGQLHSKKVHEKFGELFAMKIMIFIEELLSVVLTPFVLWFSLPKCAPAIVDFFREFSVHVDGRGYVCSFAEFDFKRHGNVKFGAPSQTRDKKMQSNEGKMEKSFLNFKAANPDWNPSDPSGSLYLQRMTDLNKVSMRNLDDRTQEYDRALCQSQIASRRRGGIARGALLGASMMRTIGGPSAASVMGGFSTAETVTLGDSQGSLHSDTHDARGAFGSESAIFSKDIELDSLVDNSGLGGPYIDGSKQPQSNVEEHDLELQDTGVLSLLTRIYSRKDTRVDL